MGFVIMAYAGKTLVENLLPSINDSNYTLKLEKQKFGTAHDVYLGLEVLKNEWRILPSSKYIITDYNKEQYNGKQIEDGEVYVLITEKKERISLIIAKTDNAYQIMHKYSLNGLNRITIGNGTDNDIQYTFKTFISKNHAVLTRNQGNSWTITDTSSNGTFINGRRIEGNYILHFGDCVCIYGLKIVFMGDRIAVSDSTFISGQMHSRLIELIDSNDYTKQYRHNPADKHFFKRSPRYMESIETDAVEIDAPPAEKTSIKKPLFLTIGPSFTMAIPMLMGSMLSIIGSKSGVSAYMFTGLITAFGSAGFGVFWALNNIRYTKAQEKDAEERRYNVYGHYLIEIANSLKEKYVHNTKVLNDTYIAADMCCSYDENNINLWNRNQNHEDFLAVRLGIGNCPFQVEINVPKEKFSMGNDELSKKPMEIKKSYETLYNVPVCIDLLKHKMIGVVGGRNLTGAYEVMLDIVAQVAVSNSYTDVRLGFIYSDDEKSRLWNFAKWLPHVWSEDKKYRLIASNKSEVGELSFEFSKVLRDREEQASLENYDKNKKVMPHYIIFVENMELLAGELIEKYIMNPKDEYGLTTILLAEKYENLPNMCEEIIENDGSFTGIYNVNESRQQMSTITFDKVSDIQVEMLARRLSGIEVNESVNGGEIPESLDFFEMYGVDSLKGLNVLDRWAKNRTYESMRALIGKKSGGSDCYLDIHEKYHGPHGLVAGTTGSGKSETLQTYMLSLAVNFSPDDIGFFIIDFKGGGMANLFSNLPHLVGQISNLSGNQVHRAMISIKSENRRRQKIFTDNNVNNINNYTKLYKNHEASEPVPHLFIIIDEFAELKREEPEFMKELISVAQVGRSLGVHLILATQKPSGTVDDNIWSNTKFRLCLRVQDRQDSNDMLHKPDAAYITQAGRGYLQVGNDEIYELFQSGYSGASYDADSLVGKTNSAVMINKMGKTIIDGAYIKKQQNVSQSLASKRTQLDVVVDYLKQIAVDNGYEQCHQLWLPVLPVELYFENLEGYKEAAFEDGKWKEHGAEFTLNVPIGLYDDPARQSQKPVIIDFAENGHLAVCGTIATGKSTFIQSLVYSVINKYSPKEVNMYLIDYSSKMLSSYENAPHVGGVMFDSDDEKIKKFFHMMKNIMNKRKEMLRGGNYSQYVRVNGLVMPAIIIAIDNYAGFAEKTGGAYDQMMIRLAKEGVGYGIYLVISCGGFGNSDLPYRIADNIRNIITLDMGDKYKFSDALRVPHISILPETDVKGRGLAVIDGDVLEYQTALSIKASDDYARMDALEKMSVHMSEVWDGDVAAAIPTIPEKPVLADIINLNEYKNMLSDKQYIPVGYNMADATIHSIDLAKTYCYLVSGKARSGKTNMLKVIMRAAIKKNNGRVIVIDNSGTDLALAASQIGAEYISSEKDIFEFFKSTIEPFKKRNVVKKQMLAAGAEEDEIYEKISEEEPYYIIIADLVRFINDIYHPNDSSLHMEAYLENITEKGFLHNFFFFGAINPDEVVKISGCKIYANMTSYKTGVHFGGFINSQRLFDFRNIPFVEQSKPMKAGLGLVPSPEDSSEARQVVIPQVKGELL